MLEFKVIHRSKDCEARVGELTINGVSLTTPVFMPVGTKGAVKTLAPRELRELGFQLILGNAYHLYLRPGVEVISKAGGLAKFMAWDGAILTDSGGYQIFSLSHKRRIKDDGVEFSSIVDGSLHFLTPEMVVEIQAKLKADIAMVLDECMPYPTRRSYAEESTARTIQWAQRSKAHFEALRPSGMHLFGIVQGSIYDDLRRDCARALSELDFDGYGIGGLSVGEPKDLQLHALKVSVENLPENKPRYFMGIGDAKGILEAVEHGIDMFDCALPTRIARNGTALIPEGRRNIRNAKYVEDMRPIQEGCGCYCCQNFTLAYIRHAFLSGEILALRLLTIHNLHFLKSLINEIISHIKNDSFLDFKQDFLSKYDYNTTVNEAEG